MTFFQPKIQPFCQFSNKTIPHICTTNTKIIDKIFNTYIFIHTFTNYLLHTIFYIDCRRGTRSVPLSNKLLDRVGIKGNGEDGKWDNWLFNNFGERFYTLFKIFILGGWGNTQTNIIKANPHRYWMVKATPLFVLCRFWIPLLHSFL